MPRFDSDAAGSMPRTASSALARVAWRNTKSLSSGCRSTVARTWSVTAARAMAVGVEQPVHVADVAGAEAAGEHGGVAVEAVAAAEPGVVGDVARALLEVAHQPAPLEHLRQQVGGLLARQVDAAELGHRVVAVLDEHLLVERLGAGDPDGGVDRVVAGDVEVADELVEEQPPQALGRAAVAGEQRALDDLGQVDEGEDRAVEVREVAPQHVGFVGGELLRDVGGHGGQL